jgi:hypothetical protein
MSGTGTRQAHEQSFFACPEIPFDETGIRRQCALNPLRDEVEQSRPIR